MSSDPSFNKRLQRLRQALETPAEADHQACLDSLDAYIASQLRGEDYGAAYPQTALHLERCLDCAAAYARLYAVQLAEQSGALASLPARPAPDLSFLRPAWAEPAGATLLERLGSALQQAGDRLSLRLSSELLALLQPGPALAAARGGEQGERYRELLLSLDPEEAGLPGLPLALKAYRDALHPQACLLEVTVTPPGRAWPDLAGTQVTLELPGERRTAITGAWGLVSFEDVPVAALPDIVVEVAL